MRAMLCCFVLAMLLGCAATRINEVNLGMSKSQVIEKLGNPVSIGASNGIEYLNYRLRESAWENDPTPYVVVIKDGRVTSFGRYGQVQ